MSHAVLIRGEIDDSLQLVFYVFNKSETERNHFGLIHLYVLVRKLKLFILQILGVARHENSHEMKKKRNPLQMATCGKRNKPTVQKSFNNEGTKKERQRAT